jgi:acyl phosphate:glycerol-3-phosphate acyltransferase
MQTILWTVVGYLLGAIPFSVLLGKLIVKKDVRSFGDGNPGGANAFKAGGAKAGIPAMILDIGKGFLPAFLAQRYGVSGWSLVPVCLAPILGHAFSPFLRFRGGKALGATAGAWMALIGLWAFPVYALLAVPLAILQSEDAWSANGGMLALLGYAILFGAPWMVAFAALNAALIAWTHRHDLVRHPHLRTWVVNLLSRRGA